MSTFVLLLAPAGAGLEAAQALRRALDAEVDLHSNAQAGAFALRQRDYALVLLDETIASADQEATERLYQSAKVPLLELNFALSSAPRIVRQARAALARRSRDIAIAQAAAAALLHSELNQTLSGLLLESELALHHATPAQQPRLREVVHMANILRDRLRA